MSANQRPLEVGVKVKFTADFLSGMAPGFVKRFSNRTGVVSGYRLGADEPIVMFAKDGRRPEVKLFEVQLSRIEVVT